MDAMVHVANLLYFASFMMRDILRLRVLTVIAASCLIPYLVLRQNLWVDIAGEWEVGGPTEG